MVGPFPGVPYSFGALRQTFGPLFVRCDVCRRQILETPYDPISHVYFVESGLVSVVGTNLPNHRIEVGMIGYEGMTGLAVVLGDDRSANETLVQSAGSAPCCAMSASS